MLAGPPNEAFVERVPGLFSVFLAMLVGLGLAWRLGKDGWYLRTTPQEYRALFVTAPPGPTAFTYVLAQALGIHPICRWLPLFRRVVVASLFVLYKVIYTFAVLA